jgi:hypothetical protein
LPDIKDSIGTAFTLASEADVRSWYEIDVTEMVQTDVDDTIAFLIAETYGSGYDFWMKSSESGNTGPKLEIIYAGLDDETDTEAPSMPSGLTASNVSFSSFDVTWEPSTDNVGILHYLILLQSNYVDTLDSESVSFTDLDQGETYTIGIIAVDSSLNRSIMARIDVTTLVDKQELTDSISSAEALIVNYAECTANQKDELQAIIDGAIAVRDNPEATKADVDNELRKLRLAVAALIDGCIQISVDEFTGDNLKIYPNPVSDHLFIDNLAGYQTIEIYAATGNLIRIIEIDNASMSVNTSELQNGIYLVRVKSLTNEVITKIVK